ncbi:MAG TPA: alpha/beta fold hydrolase [Actinocrinis sp.]|nr:alpha/beta fold hydrolase [Actinocrinis sp.]
MDGPALPTPVPAVGPGGAVPIVLVHGWGGSFESTWNAAGWAKAGAALGRPVIPIDLPGHGPHPQPHDPSAYADLASGLALALSEQGHDLSNPVDAVGFSLGAKLLLELACRDGARFGRLVLGGLGANAFAPERLGAELAAVLEADDETAASAPPMLRELARSAIDAGNDPRAVAAVLRRAPNPVLTPDRLAAVTCPVLLIAGDQDTVAQPIGRLADALSAVRSEVLPGVGHLGLPADPRFQRSALAFLTAAAHD